jgi:hypothetical protein
MLQRIELQKKPLTDEMAFRIVAGTGISYVWLKDGNPNAPMLDVFGLPYEAKRFTEISAENSGERRASKHDGFLVWRFTVHRIADLLRMTLGALERDTFLTLATTATAQFSAWKQKARLKPSPLLREGSERTAMQDAMREAPNPIRFRTPPSAAVPDAATALISIESANESRYQRALADFHGPPRLCNLISEFRDEVNKLLAAKLDGHGPPRRANDTDSLPQICTTTGHLLPLPNDGPSGTSKVERNKQQDAAIEFAAMLVHYNTLRPKLREAKLRKIKLSPFYPTLREIVQLIEQPKAKKSSVQRKRPNR